MIVNIFFCYILSNTSISGLRKAKITPGKQMDEYLMPEALDPRRHSLVIRLEDCQFKIVFNGPTCFTKASTYFYVRMMTMLI